ncbi:MAG: sigma-54-dependent Fis family transcriptional regulator [Verrucomicrobia bacterium]|nr:sigma-54-dependent Fis family transcriptional regulator [Verrucomicrobiota bacterium]
MRVLIVDDERSIRTSTSAAIRAEGHLAETADNRTVAVLKLAEEAYDLVFLDLRLGDEDGLQVLDEMKRSYPNLPVVVFTAYASIASAVSAVQRGAFDYLEKPFTPENLRQILHRIEKQRRLETRISDLQQQITLQGPQYEFSSQDPAMRSVLDVLSRAAPTQAAVLLLGESGTGKSVLARMVHDQSDRRDGPFVTVSCPSLSRELLESELFGHLRGSFTGAVRDTWGKVAAADTGTLFLDEIGELPLEIQPKLLRLLQERQYERLGESRTRAAHARIIAATNQDLRQAVKQGKFREDLYYRLDVISVQIPPLRTRPADIVALANSYLQFFAQQLGRPHLRFSADALREMQEYRWPGNLRELRNTIERAAILARSDVLEEGLTPRHIVSDDETGNLQVGSDSSLEELEEAHIRSVLDRATSLESAAKILGIDPATLYRKRKRLNL